MDEAELLIVLMRSLKWRLVQSLICCWALRERFPTVLVVQLIEIKGWAGCLRKVDAKNNTTVDTRPFLRSSAKPRALD